MSVGQHGEGTALSFLSAEAQAELKALIEETVAEALGKQQQAKWVTVKEAASLLGCSTSAVFKRVERGRLKSKRVGRSVYVSRESIDAA